MTKNDLDNLIKDMKKLKPDEVGGYLEDLRQKISPQDFEAIEKVFLVASIFV